MSRGAGDNYGAQSVPTRQDPLGSQLRVCKREQLTTLAQIDTRVVVAAATAPATEQYHCLMLVDETKRHACIEHGMCGWQLLPAERRRFERYRPPVPPRIGTYGHKDGRGDLKLHQYR